MKKRQWRFLTSALILIMRALLCILARYEWEDGPAQIVSRDWGELTRDAVKEGLLE